MDEPADDRLDPHDAIARLEARIEALEARIESCRKFIAVAKLAIALGGLLLAVTLSGLVRFDPALFFGAIAAALGGLVVAGSNRTTAREAEAERDKAAAERAVLIGRLGLRVVGGSATVH